MKTLKSAFASRVRSYQSALIAMLLASSVVQSEATIYTVNNAIYTLSYDDSQSGFTVLSFNGVDQLALQSLYYNTGSGITQLTGAAVNTGSSGHINPLYYIQVSYPIFGGMSIVDTMTLNGSTVGEKIQFLNTSGSTVNMSIYQFSHFVLGGLGDAGSQTVNMQLSSPVGASANANQYGGGITLGWSGFATANGTSGTTLVQADSGGGLFGAFTGSPTDLNNTTLNATDTYAVFGYEYSGSVDNNQSLTVSAVGQLAVPEPSSFALISFGMLAVSLISRRRREKKA
jgi:PEP-CTERM motif